MITVVDADKSGTGRPRWDITPNAKQAQAVRSTAKYLLMDGSAKWGKSFITIILFRKIIMAAPNTQGVVGRLHGTQLDASTLKDWFYLFPGDRAFFRATAGKEHLMLPGNRRIDFCHLSDLDHLKNTNLDAFLIEQAEEQPDCKVFEYLAIRSISKPNSRGFILANQDKGRNWMWPLWYANEEARELPPGVAHPETGRPHNPLFEWINGRMEDNAENLPQGSTDILKSFLSDDTYSSMVEGHMDDAGGKMYPTLSYNLHVVKPVEIPSNWLRWECHDYGITSSALAGVTARMSPAGDVVFTDEQFKHKCRIEDYANMWRQGGRPIHVQRRILDAPDWKIENKNKQDPRDADFYTLYDEFAAQGLPGERARQGSNVECFSGYEQVRSYIDIDPTHPHPFNPHITGAPWVYIFSSCKELVRQMFTYRTDDKHEPDGCACVRYILVRRPPPTRIKETFGDTQLDRYIDEIRVMNRLSGQSIGDVGRKQPEQAAPRTRREGPGVPVAMAWSKE